jgi:hypothetical protein
VICNVEDCTGIGRLPEGLCAAPIASRDAAGAFFARSAHLEAASVVAFERMARELERFGAPGELVARARAAALEEVRHAALMGAQARRFGGAVAPVEVLPQGERSLEDFAADNAREGCVRETFGAAVCAWQGLHALDPEIRRAMSEIADDEAGHAELSWDVDAWARSQLSADARARLEGIAADARRELERGTPTLTGVEPLSGHPGPEARAALLHHLDALIWA